ncbi:DUF3825 domain-containing protein [Paenibacillus enshidis]|uniref:DUF3825 domain-containing protein n=1 Tax=Paenibacillus enshidis TaxID=1458439 RepID=A0ABV5AV67_9BACL
MSFPEQLTDFAFFYKYESHLQNLADFAEKEDWDYKYTEYEYDLPVLSNYIKYTYKKLAEEEKISITDDGKYACFDTGLMTKNQEPIYAFFAKNRNKDLEPWFFTQWARKGDYCLNIFPVLPEMAHYFEDPNDLVFDTRLEIRANVEHIIEENKERFPEPFRTMDLYMVQTTFKGALDNAKMRVRRSYKIAIPQYYRGRMQLLLPICLANPNKADIALTIEKMDGFYRASTILTLDMAYNNARQIARPDKDWLQP